MSQVPANANQSGICFLGLPVWIWPLAGLLYVALRRQA